MAFDITKLDNFPTLPGVYLMKNGAGHVLYVGKANNLKQRVKQYFAAKPDSREMIPHLIAKVVEIETIVVTSEKEALLLENTLIKEHQPKYNALFKDDKTYLALKVTHRHPWPMISLVRYKGKLKADALYFGPYISAIAARKTFDLLSRIFPLRQCSDQEFARRTRPCILYDMKRCIAPCVSKCTKEEYDLNVDRTVKFLRGQNTEVLKGLYQSMEQASEALEFEKASSLLKTIRQIEGTIEYQGVHKPIGTDLDSIGLFRQGDEVILCQLIIRDGKLLKSQNYNFSGIADDDEQLISAFILQHYLPLEEIPYEILLPLELAEANVLAEITAENKKHKVHIYMPQRGEKKSLVEMALANAAATFKKEKDAQTMREKALLDMQEKLHLTRYPRRIECFDNSNISGTNPVAAMVAFTDGQKDSNRYRKYKIKTVDISDDYATMNEVLTRRYKRAKDENDLPDLILIDGGKGHLNIALKVLADLNIATVNVIGVAKEQGRHDKGMSTEQIFLPNIKDPVFFKHTSPVLFLLQQIRDEAHRVAISFHRNRRSKGVSASALDTISGIGTTRKGIILRHFGSLKKLQEASYEELGQVPGLTKANVEAIWNFIQGSKESKESKNNESKSL